MIDYAGSLAGHRVGTFKDGGGRQYLVTDEIRGIFEPMPKTFDAPEFFQEFTAELLPEGQADYLYYWLAIALRSLRRGDFRPGQVLIFAGPVQCGKSLLQYIITEILGGRSASPMRYMMEETAFNKDLAGSEHWLIEEPKTSTDTRTRIQFGNAIKECFNNRDFSIHAKGKEAITLPIFRRGTISVNNEPELLMVLPPLNGSVDDKMMLFNCHPVTDALKPFSSARGEQDRSAIWAKVISEVPAVRAWLLKHFKQVPKDRLDNRFGIAAYHHPELRKELTAFTSEARLLNILDEAFFADGELNSRKGRAMALEKELRASPVGFEADKLLRFANQFASLLGKLHRLQPERVTKHISAGYTSWEIHPPAHNTTNE
jgi:hypothetical protein